MDNFEEKLESYEPRKPSAAQRKQLLANAPVAAPTKPMKKNNPLLALATSRWFLMAALPILLFATAGICAVGFDSHSASNRWQSVEKEITQAGETLDFLSFSPVPVADADNFMATPALHGIENTSQPRDPEIMAKHDRINAVPRLVGPKSTPKDNSTELGSYTVYYPDTELNEGALVSTFEGTPEEVVINLTNSDQALWTELAAAARRPHSQPTTSLQTRVAKHGILGLSAGHLSIFQRLVHTSSLRAVAAARLGDRQTARDSLAIALKCRAGVESEPTMIGGLVTIAITAIIEKRLPDILRADCFTAEDLAWLQSEIAPFNGIDLGLQMFRTELAWSASYYDEIIAMPRKQRVEALRFNPFGDAVGLDMESALLYVLPRSFFIKNKATSIDWNYRLNLVPLKALDLDMMRAAREEFVRIEANQSWFSYGSALANMGLQDPTRISSRILAAEMHNDLIVASIALERYRLDQGSFPEKLNALVPTYLDRIPQDLASPEAPKQLAYEPASDKASYMLSATPLFLDDERDIRSLEFAR